MRVAFWSPWVFMIDELEALHMTTIGHGVAFWLFPLALRIRELDREAFVFSSHFKPVDGGILASRMTMLDDILVTKMTTGWHFGPPDDYRTAFWYP